MDYCKITTEKTAYKMPNPINLSVANPTEQQKELLATLDNWLPMTYTEPPKYNHETQYLVEYWEEENGVAVQHWKIQDIPVENNAEGENEDVENQAEFSSK